MASVGAPAIFASPSRVGPPPVADAEEGAATRASLPQGWGASGEEEVSPEEAAFVRESIERANASWIDALLRNDDVGLEAVFAEEASLFPPSSINLEGRAIIAGYLRSLRDQGMTAPVLRTVDVVAMKDLAYEVGTYQLSYEGEGDAARFRGDSGRYFAIWKRDEAGSWRYHVGIWSSNRDLRSATARH